MAKSCDSGLFSLSLLTVLAQLKIHFSFQAVFWGSSSVFAFNHRVWETQHVREVSQCVVYFCALYVLSESHDYHMASTLTSDPFIPVIKPHPLVSLDWCTCIYMYMYM